jgi:hypothetical protein
MVYIDNNMTSEIPNVIVLKPITPSVKSVDAETLEYANLLPAVEKHQKYESARMDKFWSAEQDSLEELEAGRQLAMQYLLMGSLALNQTARFSDSAKVWSERYTQASGELYGFPEPELAKQLWEERENGEKSGDRILEEAAEKLGNFLNDKYQSVFDALDLESSTDMIDPSGIADKFEAGLSVLAEEHDHAWSEWTVVRDVEKDSLSVNALGRKIIVGMRRVHEEPAKVKALFAHEVLVHGLRGLNGEKISKQLHGGLPGYLDAEEGLGVFTEYAISGEISEKNVDRYVDIAYALGQIDGQKHTRKELFDFVLERATIRNEQKSNKKSSEVLTSEAQTYVNRIYRGSQGNDNIGVFTKDISYHKGFVSMGRYISEQIADGKEIGEIMEFLTLGKFDPTNAQHVSYVESVTQSE